MPQRFAQILSASLCVFGTVTRAQDSSGYPQGFSFFQNGTLGPEANTLSTACVSAISATINCEGYLQNLITTDYYGPFDNETLQDSLCDPKCGTALSNYHSTVSSACASDPQPFDGLPATYFGDVAHATYNLVCLTDATTGEYCTDYIFNAFANYTTDSSGTGLPSDQLCSSCIISALKQIQSTPYSNYGSGLVDQWSSIQQSCSINYPTAVQPLQTNVTNLPEYSNSNTTSLPSCLSGNTYTVVGGDTCTQISISHNVSTGALIAVNQLLPGCTDLDIGQLLCLPISCSTYQVASGDSCVSIATNFDLLFPELLAWNPALNNYCTNLQAGQNICISSPGGTWTGTTIAGATVTQTAIYATATVAPPGPVAHDTTPYCGKYYTVQSGDYCQLIALNQSIALDLFSAINPSIDTNCDNLVPGLAYCVLPTAGWNATNGNATSTTLAPPAPTPPGTTGSCYEWHTVVSGDYCALIESEYDITMDQLQLWNPSLWSNCSNLDLGEAYCVNGGVGGASKMKRIVPSDGMADLVQERAVGGGVPIGYPYPRPSTWGRQGLAVE